MTVISLWADLSELGLPLPVISEDTPSAETPISPSPSAIEVFNYQLRVASALDNQGIDGATTTITIRGQTLRARTGSDGLTTHQVPSAFHGETGELIVEARDYQTKVLVVTLHREGRLTVPLDPVPTVVPMASEEPSLVASATSTNTPVPTTGTPTLTLEAAVSTTPEAEQQPLVALVSDISGEPDIYLMTMEGSIVKRVTDDPAKEQHLEWSRDGSEIALASDVNGSFDVFVYDLETEGFTSLVANYLADSAPTWSPEGDRIAFHSYVTEENADIFIMDRTRRSDFEPFFASDAEDWQPDWSPDGTQIAFMSKMDENWNIYIRDVNGLNEIKVTDHPGDDFSPAWSPDSEQIAFTSDRDGDSEIYVFKVSDRSIRKLTDNNVGDWTPVWSAEGNQIIFSSLREGSYDLYVINADGSSGAEPIVENTSREEFPAIQPSVNP